MLSMVLSIIALNLLSGAENPTINAQPSKITAQISQTIQREMKTSSVDLRAFPRFVFEIKHTQIDDPKLPKLETTSRVEQSFIHLDQSAFNLIHGEQSLAWVKHSSSIG